MKKRKGSLFMRTRAVLLSAVLVVCMVSNAAPVSVLAKENVDSSVNTDSLEKAAETAGGGTKPEEKPGAETVEGANPEGGKKTGTEGTGETGTEGSGGTGPEGTGETGIEGTGTEGTGEIGTEGTEGEGTGGTEGTEKPGIGGTEGTDGVTGTEPVGETGPETPETSTEKEQAPEAISGNGVAPGTMAIQQGAVTVAEETTKTIITGIQLEYASWCLGGVDSFREGGEKEDEVRGITIVGCICTPEYEKWGVTLNNADFGWMKEEESGGYVRYTKETWEKGTYVYKIAITIETDGAFDENVSISDPTGEVWTVAGLNDDKSEIILLSGDVVKTGHAHAWSSDWTYSETHHWHECSADDCPEADDTAKDGYGEHDYYDYGDMTCDICGYDRAPSGKDWWFDADGKLTISSAEGMTDWIANGGKYSGNVRNAEIQGEVTSIESNVFSYCRNMKSVILPDSVTSIGDGAFSSCMSLKSITIPGNVTSIGNGAFSSCVSLRSIAIPGSVTSIGDSAFYNCGLKEITMLGETPPTIGKNVFNMCKFVDDNEQGIRVPEGTAADYQREWPDWAAYITVTSNPGIVTPEVKPGNNAPAVNISTSAAELEEILLTEDEKQQVQNGTDIKIVLEVQDAGNTVSDSDKAAVQQKLNGFTIGQYLDIDLYKMAGGTRTDISETKEKLTIVLTVPNSLKNTDSQKKRTFAVIRVHGGGVEVLNDLDNNADTITIETDRFSTYAIVYQDAEDGGNGGNTGGNGGNNGGNTGDGNNGSNSGSTGGGNTGGSNSGSDGDNSGNSGSGDSSAGDNSGNNGDNSSNAGGSSNVNGNGSSNSGKTGFYNSSNNSSVNPGSSGQNAAGPGPSKGSEPKTGDAEPIELYATLAMIMGFAYLLLYFTDRKRGMTEETKKELVGRIVAWAKRGGKFRRYPALAAIFVLLVYYHSIGRKMCMRWEEVYGE